MTEGAGKSDLMVFSPNFPLPPPLAGRAAKETQLEPPPLLQTVSCPPFLASCSCLLSSHPSCLALLTFPWAGSGARSHSQGSGGVDVWQVLKDVNVTFASAFVSSLDLFGC